MPSGNRILRLFAAAPALCLLAAPLLHAQPDPPELLHLAHLQGVYVNAAGKPIANADVTLERNDKVLSATKTDAAGRFVIKHVSGRCWLHLSARNYPQVRREAVIGAEALVYLRSSKLYIIAGPAACTDDCSSIFTNKSSFDQQLKHNAGHYD